MPSTVIYLFVLFDSLLLWIPVLPKRYEHPPSRFQVWAIMLDLFLELDFLNLNIINHLDKILSSRSKGLNHISLFISLQTCRNKGLIYLPSESREQRRFPTSSILNSLVVWGREKGRLLWGPCTLNSQVKLFVNILILFNVCNGIGTQNHSYAIQVMLRGIYFWTSHNQERSLLQSHQTLRKLCAAANMTRAFLLKSQ